MMIHVVDDEAIIREILECFITDAGFRALTFESGARYLEHLNSPDFENPVAILSDVTMPGMNGYDLVEKIREQHPRQKIILITGNADADHNRKAAAQLCYTLQKPFQPDQLIEVIQAVATCEAAHRGHEKTEYHPQCEYGLNHPCPFYPDHCTGHHA